MNPFQNYDQRAPLISCVVTMHAGDYHYWPRALASIQAQDTPHEQLEVLIAFDGPASPEIEEFLVAEGAKSDLEIKLFTTLEGELPSGYYTYPRNRVMPYILGYYVANLDVDNEWLAGHLSGLLKAIRNPAPDGSGWPHFTYSRREYVDDTGKGGVPTGPSPLREWTPENVSMLVQSPMCNFVDTSDFLVGKSTLYALAEATGMVWNQESRRFGDWELIARMARCGFRGLAVDQITQLYHWTGNNVQLTRPAEELIPMSEDVYEQYKKEGKIRVS